MGRDDQYPYRRGRRDAGGESQDRVESQYGRSRASLGYIIGLKYSLIICAGSFLVWLVIIPAMSAIFSADVLTFGNDAITATVGSMSAEQIFTTYARHIGIGGIATAGVIGIINSWGIIKGAVGLAANELKGKGDAVESNTIRTQRICR